MKQLTHLDSTMELAQILEPITLADVSLESASFCLLILWENGIKNEPTEELHVSLAGLVVC